MAQEVAAPLSIEEAAPPHIPTSRRALRMARRHPLGVFGLLVIAVLVSAGFFAELMAPYDPLSPNRITKAFAELSAPVDAETTTFTVKDGADLGYGQTVGIESEEIIVLNIAGNTITVQRGAEQTEATSHDAGAALGSSTVDTLSRPSAKHPFGTDRLGRDVLSRTIFGARISLMIGMVAILFGVTVGSFLGVLSGYIGRFVDSVIQRSVDALLAFPPVVLLLAVITVIGDEDSAVRTFLADNTPIPQDTFLGVPDFLDIFVISLAIGLAVVASVARVVRGAVLSIKENVYIEAARAMGASDSRIMWRHILPNVAALIVILASITLPLAILAEAAISFLGVGVQPPVPSWGADMTGPNRELALSGTWWPVFFPGLALSLVVLGFNMLGDAFRDISDPRLRGALGSGGGRSL